jgi:cbb3-type cytochrome oxidase maturation protein
VSILFVLIAVGLALLALAAWAFIWAVDHDQFEDLEQAAHSILLDADEAARAARGRAEGGSA